jgi:hypothetical protein
MPLTTKPTSTASILSILPDKRNLWLVEVYTQVIKVSQVVKKLKFPPSGTKLGDFMKLCIFRK